MLLLFGDALGKCTFYHHLTRTNTPDRASFRRLLPFSPWWAPAHLRLKNQKPLEDPSLSGAGSFAGAEMCPDKERPAEDTAVSSRGLTMYGPISARQNRVCPCQAMVQLIPFTFCVDISLSAKPQVVLTENGHRKRSVDFLADLGK